MRIETAIVLLWGLLAACPQARAQGHVLWDEDRDGLLSEDGNNPTHLGALALGTNSVSGSVQLTPIGGNYFRQLDYFTFEAVTSTQIREIFFTAGHGTWVWLGQGGFADRLGFLMDPSNGAILGQMGISAPLPADTYAIYVRDNYYQPWPTDVDYRLDIVVEVVPEPTTSVLLFCGGVGLLLWRRQARKANLRSETRTFPISLHSSSSSHCSDPSE